MTLQEQFDNGIAVGKMYASTPIWWNGFIIGNMIGVWKNWFKMLEGQWRPSYPKRRDSEPSYSKRLQRYLLRAAAKVRERNGDIEGADRMRFAANCVSGDNRRRHDRT